MTLFCIELLSTITNHPLYLDRFLADILWFNISNLRRCYIYIYIWSLWSSSYTRYLNFEKNSSGIDFQIVSSTLIFIFTSLNRELFFSKLYYYILMIKYNIKTLMIIIDDIVIESRIKFESYLSIDLNFIEEVYCSLSQVFWKENG